MRRGAARRIIVSICAAIWLAACSSGAPSDEPPALLPVTLPDLARSDASVQAQGQELYASLMRTIEDPAVPPAALSEAYGEFGMFLHAAEYVDAAEPCYRNAQRLAPRDPRWPYYLGHVYRARGESARAISAFERALTLQPDDLATLVWLARLQHERGRADEAERLYGRARSVAPDAVAVLAGLGQLALARDDFAAAARHFEEALTRDPQAAALHSPLAMAYRGLGETARAEAHLAQWRNRDVPLPDPLSEELDLVLESGLAYELRGVRALETGDWKTTADLFRRGVELTEGTTPLGRSLRHKLGTALVLGGDLPGAVAQFREVLRLAPPEGLDEATARAHYSLGVLMASGGYGPRAIEHLTAAVRYNPTYPEAHVALADALRRAGRTAASIDHYREAAALNPRSAEYARVGHGIALASLGRYRESLDLFEEAARLHRGSPDVLNGLVRLLAAAPDAAVRDEQRAAALAGELSRAPRTIELGETLAMVRAASGDWMEAVSIQRSVIQAAVQAGLHVWVRGMTEDLHRYERRERARVPWHRDHPAHTPGPDIDPAIRTALAAAS